MDARITKLLPVCCAVLALAGCATTPTEPSIMALPGSGRSFEEFRNDDGYCRTYAFQSSGAGTREQSANTSAIQNAAIGTAIGTVAGAAIGGRQGSGVGAGMGLVVGSATGAEASRRSQYGGQRQYDTAYVQCMYARGHRVPVSGAYTSEKAAAPAAVLPPPPPGNPPPPPESR